VVGALAIKHTLYQGGRAEPTSAQGIGGFLLSTLSSPLVLIGLVAIGLSACAWIVALSRMELSIAYPVAVALNCLIVVSAGFVAYAEPLNWSKLLGTGMLLCSLLLLYRGS
jgi:multidrug transporter EmrE-like cation transporter